MWTGWIRDGDGSWQQQALFLGKRGHKNLWCTEQP